MKNTFIALLLLLFFGYGSGQTVLHSVSIDEDGNLQLSETEMPFNATVKPGSLDPEPFMVFSRESFPIKNTRGVALADLDGDGVDEILFGIDHTFYAIKGDGSILFEKTLPGPVLLPPAIADMNGDGNLEIAVNYGYPSTTGGITLLDNEGNELPGWPQSFDGNWMINSPAMGDLDGDGIMEIVAGERVSASVGHVHAMKMDGTPLNSNWPVTITSTPAFTPSIGDINNDGVMDVVIAGSSTGMYVFSADDGELLPGFPVDAAGVGYSYQSPQLADLNGDGNLEIIGSNHGDNPAMYVMKSDGTYMDGWPYALPSWTYSPATVADVDGDGILDIFMGFPNQSQNPMDVIYGMQPDGSDMDNFPIEKVGGNEGVITIADVNNDGIMDVIFGSNTYDQDNFGFLHAYSVDGSGEIDGFPLRPKGMTYMNGAVIGDVDDDGQMDLTVLSYTSLFGAGVDSTFVSTYNLGVPYEPSKILRNGYKGNNTRNGLVEEEELNLTEVSLSQIGVYPNPSSGELNIRLEKESADFSLTVLDMSGRRVFYETSNKLSSQHSYNLRHLPKGTYILYIRSGQSQQALKWIKK